MNSSRPKWLVNQKRDQSPFTTQIGLLYGMGRMWFCCTCVSLFTIACTSKNFDNSTIKQDSQTVATSSITASGTSQSSELLEYIQKISGAAQGKVGVAAMVLETGETIALNGDQQFPMQSVYKFPIGMAVLAQVDQGKLRLEQRVRVMPEDFVSERQHSPIRDNHPQGVELTIAELLKYMVSESDGTACDVLLQVMGGTEIVMTYLQSLAVDDIVVLNTEKEIGQDNSVQYRNWATPEAMVKLLKALHQGRGLSASSRALLLQFMTETPTGLQRIKGRLPKGTVVAHKTGTSRTVNGVAAATNDVGLITLPNGQQMAIAVFVSDARADDATREAVIAQITKILWDEWSQPS